MKKLLLCSISLISIFFVNCATNLPMTSSLNDFVMMGIKTNSDHTISYGFASEVQDELIKPYDRDKSTKIESHPGFNHTESFTLSRMVNEYMSNKFVNRQDTCNYHIKVILKDFWLEQYAIDSAGKQFAVAMLGGEVNYMCIARLKVLLELTFDGEVYHKNISVNSEDTYVHGVSTGTSTSNYYRGKESIQHIHAENINKANNKVVMMMNAYFDEIGF